MSAPGESVIRVDNVGKSYGEIEAVKSLSFSVEASTCVGLLGPNGAGKTTMLKMIYAKCLRDPRPGSSITVFGHDPGTSELAIKSLSGVVPQEDNLDEELSVLQNLRVYAKLYGMRRTETDPRIDELLAFMELGEKKLVKIKELSGGMKRRLIIARALLNTPRLLILDEPTTGLDPQVRHLIWDKLTRLKREGLTILLTTHYMEEAFQICDSVLIMHKGVKLMEGAPRALLEGRLEPFVLEARGGALAARLLQRAHSASVRVEAGPEAVRVFSRDHGALREIAAELGGGNAPGAPGGNAPGAPGGNAPGAPEGEFNIRPTNLEDLFLQATGSELDE